MCFFEIFKNTFWDALKKNSDLKYCPAVKLFTLLIIRSDSLMW